MPLSNDDKKVYKNLYLKTAREYVVQMTDQLEQFSSGEHATSFVDDFHREAHSLKGQSLMMEYAHIGELARQIEYLFASYAERDVTIKAEEITIIKQAIVAIAACLDQIESEDTEADLSDLTSQIEMLQDKK